MTAPPEPRIDLTLVAALDLYFERLGDAKPHAVYDMVIGAIEPTLLRYALDRCQGNISKTADLLGLSRNTLRKKLQQHRMT
ncbi:Fis Factor for inversion stimulation Fis, transcriptional activator [Burkholderiales bacterium]|jgi:Fis family transcriptional regulator